MLFRFAAFALPLSALLIGLMLFGCARSRVNPVPEAAVQQPSPTTAESAPVTLKKICIVENPRVQKDFLDAYTKALSERGYEVQVFPKTPPASQCPLTSRYTATWAWDLVFYLAYAELRVYRDTKPAGRAEFRARGSRLIDTESKVKELVDQLLPK